MRGSSFSAALRKAQTALDEFGVEGIRTNISFLREILSHSEIHAGAVTTGFVDDNLSALVGGVQTWNHELRPTTPELYPGEEVLRAQLAGTVIEIVAEGTELAAGGQLAVVEAMKMHHVLVAPDALRATWKYLCALAALRLCVERKGFHSSCRFELRSLSASFFLGPKRRWTSWIVRRRRSGPTSFPSPFL